MECIVQKGITKDLYNNPLEKLTLLDFDKIYIEYASHKIGFMNDGKIFINSLLFDLKNNISDYQFVPTKYETRKINIKTGKDECFRKNIGYHLYNDNIELAYILRCYSNGEVYLYAYKKYGEEFKEQEIKMI